ncbi:YbjQ family protein [Salinibius halmophilus]|uniref:YbjQ family protein n=1 Tax=Salinibius halmophilus TaxID=1853216 RepID=UPI000E675C70|nr:YbjQ family protein [Salinibius halmophilus]
MLTSNIETLPGYRITQHLGLVEGSTVRAKNVGRDILSSIKNLFGGELESYTDLMREARAEAETRMLEAAKQLGANAVINIRFSTTSIADGASEVLAYGTAVVVE